MEKATHGTTTLPVAPAQAGDARSAPARTLGAKEPRPGPYSPKARTVTWSAHTLSRACQSS